jgi:protein-tyrosine-phosphatase
MIFVDIVGIIGNICRSPMAKAVLVHAINERGHADLFAIDSAGISERHVILGHVYILTLELISVHNVDR